MRVYGSVQLSFWENSAFQSVSDQAKLLAIYLLTGPHSNMLGCFRLPEGYIKEDLGWSTDTVNETFQELSEIDFLTRDHKSSWIVIHQFLKWNPIQNPRQGVGIRKLFDLVNPSSTVYKPLVNSLLMFGKYLDKGFLDGLDTLKNSVETLSEDCAADKDQEQDQDQDSDNKKHIMSNYQKSAVLKSQALEVLNFLNEKTGKAFRPVDVNLNMIITRLKSGASVEDCRRVIAMKYREWKKDPEMVKYVRPETLFRSSKFESYLGELVMPKEEGGESG